MSALPTTVSGASPGLLLVDVSLHVLGAEPFAIGSDGEPVALTRGQWSVLAPMIEQPNTLLGPEAIKDRLCSDPARTSGGSLHTQMWNLRRRLDQAGLGRPSLLPHLAWGYRLDVEPWQLDTMRFDLVGGAALRALERRELVLARDLLAAALELVVDTVDCRAIPFTHAFLAWISERARELRMHLYNVRLALGEHRALVPVLSARLDADPLDVEIATALMVALYRCGRPRDALARARQVQRAARSVGLRPAPQLEGAERAVLNDHPSLLAPTPGREWPARPRSCGAVLHATWQPRRRSPWAIADCEFAVLVPECGGQLLAMSGPSLSGAFPTTEHAVAAAHALSNVLATHAGVQGTFAVAHGRAGQGACCTHLLRRAVHLHHGASEGELRFGG